MFSKCSERRGPCPQSRIRRDGGAAQRPTPRRMGWIEADDRGPATLDSAAGSQDTGRSDPKQATNAMCMVGSLLQGGGGLLHAVPVWHFPRPKIPEGGNLGGRKARTMMQLQHYLLTINASPWGRDAPRATPKLADTNDETRALTKTR
jgi:hypothetical protein